jgi:hypothetical protein
VRAQCGGYVCLSYTYSVQTGSIQFASCNGSKGLSFTTTGQRNICQCCTSNVACLTHSLPTWQPSSSASHGGDDLHAARPPDRPHASPSVWLHGGAPPQTPAGHQFHQSSPPQLCHPFHYIRRATLCGLYPPTMPRYLQVISPSTYTPKGPGSQPTESRNYCLTSGGNVISRFFFKTLALAIKINNLLSTSYAAK